MAFHFNMIFICLTRWFTRLVEMIYLKIHASDSINNSSNICFLLLFMQAYHTGIFLPLIIYHSIQYKEVDNFLLVTGQFSSFFLLSMVFTFSILLYFFVSVQFMCVFHGFSDSFSLCLVTSYYVSEALWSQLLKRSPDYIFCFCSLKYDNVFSHSLLNLFVIFTLLPKVQISDPVLFLPFKFSLPSLYHMFPGR